MSVKTFLKPGLLIFSILIPSVICAQPEVMAWGNSTGIRVEGKLMEFESSLRVVENGWQNYSATGKEKQQPKYDRDGLKRLFQDAWIRVFVPRWKWPEDWTASVCPS